MSEKLSLMGVALRNLGGSCPVEVMTRYTDFNVVEVTDPSGKPMSAPANSLVAFTSHRYFQVLDEDGPLDLWEFRVAIPGTGGGPSTEGRLFIAGDDILIVRAASNVVS